MHVQEIDPVNNSSECRGSAACHGAELVFEWDNAAAYNITLTRDEQHLVQALAAAVRQFAEQASIAWPVFDPQSLAFMQLQVRVTLGSCCCCFARTHAHASHIMQAPTPIPSLNEGTPQCALWSAASSRRAATGLLMALFEKQRGNL